jgi:xanthine/CO dehydrogenase XdhC/CoxF family maturation factor
MDRRNLKIIEEGIIHGQEIHVVRIFDANSRVLRRSAIASENGSDGLPGPLRDAIKEVESEMIVSRSSVEMRDMSYATGGATKVVVEGLRPKLKLVVFGAGHVGQAVALIGVLLGFDVVLIDDRPEFASRRRLPDPRINLIVGDYEKVVSGLSLSSSSAVVIVTRGHQFDEVCLRGTVRSSAGYLGMIGSKRRVLSIVNKLEKDGFVKADFENLHAPIGLRIGARSPQEIAVAILAEIVDHFNGKNRK